MPWRIPARVGAPQNRRALLVAVSFGSTPPAPLVFPVLALQIPRTSGRVYPQSSRPVLYTPGPPRRCARRPRSAHADTACVLVERRLERVPCTRACPARRAGGSGRERALGVSILTSRGRGNALDSTRRPAGRWRFPRLAPRPWLLFFLPLAFATPAVGHGLPAPSPRSCRLAGSPGPRPRPWPSSSRPSAPRRPCLRV